VSIGFVYGALARGAKAAVVLGVVLGLVTLAQPGGQGAWAAPPPHVPSLLVFGDSLVAGYGLAHEDGFEAQLKAALQRAGHPVRILDGGVSGDTSAGGRARLDWALADNPDAAIVELGANDALRGTDPAETAANLTAILDTLAARHIPVLLCGMLAPPNLGAAYGAQFKAVYQRLAGRQGVLFYPFFLDGVAGDAALNQADHMHPNPRGVTVIVGRILPVVEQLLIFVPIKTF
jgi:acyl-CoA thioesterase-1